MAQRARRRLPNAATAGANPARPRSPADTPLWALHRSVGNRRFAAAAAGPVGAPASARHVAHHGEHLLALTDLWHGHLERRRAERHRWVQQAYGRSEADARRLLDAPMPPPARAWDAPDAHLDEVAASAAGGNHGEASRHLDHFERTYNEAQREWNAYLTRATGTADRSAAGISTRRDAALEVQGIEMGMSREWERLVGAGGVAGPALADLLVRLADRRLVEGSLRDGLVAGFVDGFAMEPLVQAVGADSGAALMANPVTVAGLLGDAMAEQTGGAVFKAMRAGLKSRAGGLGQDQALATAIGSALAAGPVMDRFIEGAKALSARLAVTPNGS